MLPHLQKLVLADTKLTIEDADLLLDLYGAWKLKWPEPIANSDGFVTFRHLKKSVLNPTLFSRRVQKLKRASLLEIRQDKDAALPSAKGGKVDKRSKSARISTDGIRRIEPLYQKYARICDILLDGVTEKDRETIVQASNRILEKLRRWDELPISTA